MPDIPRLPPGTTAFQKGKELFDKDLAKVLVDRRFTRSLMEHYYD